MLKITTTNGDELIHADQQPDAYTGQAYDGSQYLVHAGEWGRHKYIRKEGNRYIYPEDLQKKASAGLHKVTQVAKDVYNDRDTYVKAAKNMASDAREIAERQKYRMKDELRKQHEERQAKSDHIKDRNKKMAEGAKKLGKAMWDSSKIGNLVNLGKESAEGINSLANSSKKEEVAERSMPTSVKNVGKRPVSRQKKVVDGGKSIEKGEAVGKTKVTRTSENQKKKVRNVEDQAPRSPRLNNIQVAKKFSVTKTDADSKKAKEMDQIVSAHANSVYDEGVRKGGEKYYTSRKTGDNKGLKSPEHLEEAKRATKERRKEAKKREKLEKAAINSAHTGAKLYKEKYPNGATTETLELQKKKTADRKRVASERAQKEEAQIRAAHNGDVNRTETNKANSLEEQRRKTEARRIIKANKARTDAQINSAHRR